jgi:WD40 repeat protein
VVDRPIDKSCATYSGTRPQLKQSDLDFRETRFTMDRNDGIVRWSPCPARDEFLTINLAQRVLQIYEPKGHARPGLFEYQKVSKFHDFPHLSAYDWSPTIPALVALGTTHGEVHLLRVDDDSNSYITLPLKLQRLCQSVAFNTTGLLAVGLDRVRNDSCLQVWDINQRLAGWDPKQPGWNVSAMALEPRKLEASLSITSVRFFEDQPQTLAVGVKNQSVKIHDLRGCIFKSCYFAHLLTYQQIQIQRLSHSKPVVTTTWPSTMLIPTISHLLP